MLSESAILTKSSKEGELHYTEQKAFSTVTSWVEEFVRAADMHTLRSGLSLTTPEAFLFKRSSTLLPAENSNTLTLLQIDPVYAYKVITHDTLSDTFHAFACPRYDADFRLSSEDEHFIGASSNCLLELQGKSYVHSGKSECRDFKLRPSPSDRCHKEALEDTRLLFPIKNHLTLYVSKNGDLRLVQYKLGNIVENQPLVSPIKRILFSLKEVDGIIIVSVDVTFPSGRSDSYTTSTSITKTSHYNLLFHPA